MRESVLSTSLRANNGMNCEEVACKFERSFFNLVGETQDGLLHEETVELLCRSCLH